MWTLPSKPTVTLDNTGPSVSKRHLTQPSSGPETAAAEPVIATWHDPCHASRGQGLVREPRDVLRALPGVEFRELPEADWCCGGAGSYALSHYDMSQQIGNRKMDNVEKTGAGLLVTSCPACIIQLTYCVRKRGLPVRVCHLSELVAERCGEPAGQSSGPAGLQTPGDM